jgi:hypothetical protein
MSDKVLVGDNDLARENDSIEVVFVCWMNQWCMYTLLLTLYMIRRSVYSEIETKRQCRCYLYIGNSGGVDVGEIRVTNLLHQ